jgi:hypothetical protein
VLQVNFSFCGILQAACIGLAACAAAASADAASAEGTLVPLTVCEIVHDLPAQDGKIVAAIGRYSFRSDGRWIGEQACQTSGDTPELWLVEDIKDGPRPPEHLNLDSASLKKKFAEVQSRSTLGKFKFGTSDYDRWAIVYGRVERRSGGDPKKGPANLVFRGSSVIIVITPGEW